MEEILAAREDYLKMSLEYYTNAALAGIDDAARDELWNTAVENQPR